MSADNLSPCVAGRELAVNVTMPVDGCRTCYWDRNYSVLAEVSG